MSKRIAESCSFESFCQTNENYELLFNVPMEIGQIIISHLTLPELIALKRTNRSAGNQAEDGIFRKTVEITKKSKTASNPLHRFYSNALEYKCFSEPWTATTQRQVIGVFGAMMSHGPRPDRTMLEFAERSEHYTIVCWLRSVGVRFNDAISERWFFNKFFQSWEETPKIPTDFLNGYARAAPGVKFWTPSLDRLCFASGIPNCPKWMRENHPNCVLKKAFKIKHAIQFSAYGEKFWTEMYSTFAPEIQTLDRNLEGLVETLVDMEKFFQERAAESNSSSIPVKLIDFFSEKLK